MEETAIAAYWVTGGAGFLPRHCVHQEGTTYDGHLVQVVKLLAESENGSERRHSRYNRRGVCFATIVNSLSTKARALRNEEQQQSILDVNALAAAILAEGCSSDSDNEAQAL